jgi:hypothetical protein
MNWSILFYFFNDNEANCPFSRKKSICALELNSAIYIEMVINGITYP